MDRRSDHMAPVVTPDSRVSLSSALRVTLEFGVQTGATPRDASPTRTLLVPSRFRANGNPTLIERHKVYETSAPAGTHWPSRTYGVAIANSELMGGRSAGRV